MNAREKTPAAFPPATAADTVWGTVLPIPAADDDFEIRVRRAWDHLRTACFAEAEHDELRRVLVRVIAAEREDG